MTAQPRNPLRAPAVPFLIGLALILMFALGFSLIASLRSTPALVESTLAAPESRIRIQHIPAEPDTDTAPFNDETGNQFDASIRTQLQMRPDVQVANGVEFTASNFVLRSRQLFVNVCYQQPGLGVWDVNAATLDYGTGSTPQLRGHETYLELASEIGQMGRRCLALEFEIPNQADLARLTLTVERIGLVAPAAGRECAVYSARLANAVTVLDSGITAECVQQTGGVQLRIVTKPESMTQEEAEALVGKAVSGVIEGPWVFTDDLSE